ncbi:MAG TPA: aminotransferase class IV family protein [Rudaea sp.]|nr:aminotransferase class IV family protein [Rudaea sp.]
MIDAARIELNGRPASAEDLRPLIQSNYGHFTAFEARAGRVQGFALHLERLVRGTRTLFGSDLDPERLRACVRQAIGSDAALSVRVNVFSRAFDRELPGAAAEPDILVIVAPAKPRSAAPARLKSFRYGRELPDVKHVGTFPLFHFRARAQQAGFDDALFAGADGRIAEASVWNLGFLDGDGVVWPDAPQLRGVGQELLARGMQRLGVPQSRRAIGLGDVAAFRGAFVTNAMVPVRAVAAIDDIAFAIDEATLALLRRCRDDNPWEPV